MASEPNGLRHLLACAGWTARDLGRAVNAWLSEHGRTNEKIHPTTPYSWVQRGFCPYGPYPQIAAEVLSKRLGQRITVADLWPERAPERALNGKFADDGLRGEWAVESALDHLDGLVDSSDPERQHLGAVSGATLVTSALDGWTHSPVPMLAGLAADQVHPPLMSLISEHIAALRRLDDRSGGGALSLRYMRGELRGVLDMLRYSTYDSAVGKSLLLAVANLAQLSGWMHFDAGEHGAGQRYFLLGLRTARAAGEDECAANILGMLAYQAAHTGQPAEAVRLAETAARVTARGTAATRARIAGRLATAYAANGDVYAFREAAEHACTLLGKRNSGDDPPFLYYFTADQLSAETGQALVDLACLNPSRRRLLLTEATELLTPITSSSPHECYQRSALLHGCYLAQAHVRRGELEQAMDAARTAVDRLSGVQSGRCRALLRRLRSDLVMRKRNRHVAEFLPELDRALANA